MMWKSMKKGICLMVAVVMLLAMLAACDSDTENTTPTEGDPTMIIENQNVQNSGIRVLSYPQDAVKSLGDRGILLSEFSARAAGASSYEGNRHYDGTSVVISSHFSATIQDMPLPVYAAPVYIAEENRGTIHSYASIDVDFSRNEQVTISLQVASFIKVRSAQLYAHDPAVLEYDTKEIYLTVSANGVYTVVLNDRQDYAVTLFVRTYEDEEAKIAEYQNLYGRDNVTVFEPGLHEIDYHLMMEDNSVLYLKAGAILLPKHTIDIMDDAAAAGEAEYGAKEANMLGLNRYPVINGFYADNLIIAGRGTVDMTQLDWHERRGIVFSMCENVSMDGMIMINPSEWAFITYRCQNVSVTQSAVLGYRTNSDAFAICNTIKAEITDCFARTGDDMFEVKTLGGPDDAVSKDITYRRCQAWGSKARCFGVIGEIEKDVSDILFEDGIVIFRDATWDNNRIGSLVVLRECGNGVVDGVTFRNITVHYDAGRPIQVGNYSSGLSNTTIKNVIFEDVTITAKMNSQIRTNSNDENDLNVILRRVRINENIITNGNMDTFIYCDQAGLVRVE